MKPAPEQTGAPAIYAGRFANEVSQSLPDSEVLDEWEVLPHQLAAATREASGLIVLDPLSFPFEAMTDEQWDLPLLVTLPPEFDAETLTTVFGPALFDRLGPFDRIATADSGLWEALRRRYSWSNSQLAALESTNPAEAAGELSKLLESISEHLYRQKTIHRAQARALASRIPTLRQAQTTGPLKILEVGAGDGYWPTSFDLSKTCFSGAYTEDAAVEAAQRDFPEHSFSSTGKAFEIAQSDNTFDLGFSVNFIQVQSNSARRTIVSEMWRVTRSGGRLIFVDDFVGEGSEGQKILPVSLPEFVELIVEATAGRVVLDHVESLRYPGEEMFRGALISLQKLGTPEDG